MLLQKQKEGNSTQLHYVPQSLENNSDLLFKYPKHYMNTARETVYFPLLEPPPKGSA